MAAPPMTSRSPPRPAAPLPALIDTILQPLAAFFRLEAASGILLLGCAALALAWANLAPASYRATFKALLSVRLAGAGLEFTVAQLVNDGLMAVFFFVVGMEIKHELTVGELKTLRQALLPAAAALGGMLLPAAIFLGLNAGSPGAPGFGIPVATDIAFSIGVLTLLRRRVPRALFVFVTALAIFDDLGGIVVIAVFYGAGVNLAWLAATAVVLAGLFLLSRAQVHSALAWIAAGTLLWLALHASGIHPSISGALLGLFIPARARRRAGNAIRNLSAQARPAPDGDELRDEVAIEEIEGQLQEAEPPLARFVRVLHPWVAFGVMPLFALANSGVELLALHTSGPGEKVALGTALSLFLGKQAGIFAFTVAAVRAGLASLPSGTTLPKLWGASLVAGIGFTVSLFIAGLAYPDAPALLDEAKLGILGGSFLAGAVGALVLRCTHPVDVGPLPHPSLGRRSGEDGVSGERRCSSTTSSSDPDSAEASAGSGSSRRDTAS
ncbi:MAG TPA: Na+/H+ antiporter NhaA [Anaeromyxobacter sp.]|nr:Na+/H+ antiporter NhaA [Anaeromyxobacter sp.]